MTKNILITGGCGFVGANLIDVLRQDTDVQIKVLDNESMGRREWISQFDVEFYESDIRNSAEVEKALVGVDTVVHLAADTRVMDSISNPVLNFETNVVGSFTLLSAMRKAGVQRIVNASTGGAILGEVPPPVDENMAPHPTSPYGASKLAVEGYLSAFSGAYGMAATSLRFSNVYGLYSYHKGSVVAHFLKNILLGQPLVVYGDGSQTRDYVFSQDLVRGIISAIQSDVSGVYQLGTGKATSLNELIDIMRTIVGSQYDFDVEYKDFRDGEIRHTYCNIDKAKNALGYAPASGLTTGLSKTWDWFCENRRYFEAS